MTTERVEDEQIQYKEGYKYWLYGDYICQTKIFPDAPIHHKFFTLDVDGWLYIKAGYAWDGPSGPCPDIRAMMRGSLKHDCLYQMMRTGLLDLSWRRQVDKTLELDYINDANYRSKRWGRFKKLFGKIVYWSVDVGGEGSATHPRVVLVAP